MTSSFLLHHRGIAILAGLDFPGEFYVDFGATPAVLYYIPMPGETADTANAVIPILDRLVQLEGSSASSPVQYITFAGLNFNYTTDGGARHTAYIAETAAVEVCLQPTSFSHSFLIIAACADALHLSRGVPRPHRLPLRWQRHFNGRGHR